MARSKIDLDGKQSAKKQSGGSGDGGPDKKKLILVGVSVTCLIAAGVVTFMSMRTPPPSPADLAPPPVEMTPEQQKQVEREMQLQERTFKARPPVGS
jgi:hypothetical protein